MIEKLKLCRYEHPVLRRPTLPIKKFTPLLGEIADKMFEIMGTHKGCGLAAPQVGLSWQMFVMDLGKPMVFINPEVTSSGPLRSCNEGCLSLPGIDLTILRPRDAYIEWQDLNGKTFKAKYAGMYARCIQHEYDHLNATLIIDHCDPLVVARHIAYMPSGVPSEEDLQLMYEWEKHDALGF